MAVVGLASRLPRFIGIFTIAIVAAIPLITLANDTASFLTPDGMKMASSPVFLQTLIFGTTYAALGEMVPSFIFSFVIMHYVRDFFLKDGGSHASKYVKEGVVKSVQENVFSYEQPTSS